MTQYRTIVVDPPWDLTTGPSWDFGQPSKKAPYPTMTIGEIAALPVRSLSTNIDHDAHLYLWTVNAYLREAFDIAQGWGFWHSQTIVWCKDQAGIGMGGTWPSNIEFVLFCRRPKLTTRPDAVEVTTWLYEQSRAAHISEDEINTHMGTRRMAMWWISRNPRMAAVPRWEQWERLRDLIRFGHEMDDRVREINAQKRTAQYDRGARAPSSWFTWKRGKHSVKPEAFLDIVESVSPGPYLEMFARRNRLGWDTWGNEALEHVSMVAQK